ncbi:MAG: MBL fold metallo-hydrolase [Phycisphaerae bacterium]|nr:MBL fold metallo-hydrolase [Phycisphaerae bacterium]
MIFRRFTVGGYPINGYLIADSETKIGVFIDPGGFNDEIDAYVSHFKIQLRHIFFTHGHWDHTEGLAEFSKHYAVQCYGGQGEVRAVSNVLHGGEPIMVGPLRFTAISTPGHTPGGMSYYCHDRVFTGDALFCGSVGGTESQDDRERQLEHVRKNIFTLPDDTLVFPAHGPMTTVAAEKYYNPFF